jgi:hypothetical protein
LTSRCQWLQSRVWLDGLFVTRCPLHTEANDSAIVFAVIDVVPHFAARETRQLS